MHTTTPAPELPIERLFGQPNLDANLSDAGGRVEP